MLVINLIIAAGALYVGERVLQMTQKQKKSPSQQLTQKRKKTSVSLITEKKTASDGSQNTEVLPFLEKAQQVLPFFDQHRQLLQKITSTEQEKEKSDKEKKIDQLVGLSLASLGLTTASTLLYPPLTLVALPVLLYLGVPIYQDAYHALVKEKKVRVAVVDSIIITLAIAAGQAAAVSLAYVLVFASQKLLLKTEDQSQQRIVDLFGIQQTSVWLLSDGVEVETPLDALQKGDVIVVNAGESIPVDGVITAGVASIDQHVLTGEAQPVEKGVGEKVFASTIILTGRLYIKVETTGQETTVAQIGQILANTADYKMIIRSRGEKIVDRASLPILGFGAFSLWFLGPVGAMAAVASCMATDVRIVAPLVMLSYLTLTVREGILIKDGRVLDLLNQVDTIVFDKTGTLTLQKPHVADIHLCAEGYSADKLLTYAAAAEYKQTHPIALAILEEASARELTLPPIEKTAVKVGYGLSVMIQHEYEHDHEQGHEQEHEHQCQHVRVGSKRFMVMEGITIPARIEALQASCHEKGASLVMVAVDEHLIGAIELHATVRPEAQEVITQLRKRFSSMYIISGDHETPTKKLALELGIEHYFAETLPEQKAALIEELQAAGKSVCYVGDGINDSIALKTANVSISLRGASSVATDTAQIILMNENLTQLQTVFELGEHYEADMNRTLFAKMSPAFVGVPGAFLLNFNFATAVILNNLGIVAGVGSAMWPLLKEQEEKPRTELQGDTNQP